MNKMDPQDRADNFLAVIGGTKDGVKPYKTRLDEAQSKLKENLEEWHDKIAKEDWYTALHNTKVGLSESYLVPLRKACRIIRDTNLDANTLKLVNNLFTERNAPDFESFHSVCDHIEQFVFIIDKYFEASRKVVGEDPIHRNNTNLSGSMWRVYFLNYRRRDLYQRGEQYKEPLLGIGIISIDNNIDQSAKPSVSLKNTGIDSSADYIGKYTSFITIDNGILVFDMHVPTEPKRNLHIQLSCQDKNQEIMLGGYLSYEAGSIQLGKIIFHRMEDEDSELSPNCYSIYSNNELFKDINDTIIEYLTLRYKNYHKIESDIRTIKDLKDALHADMEFEERNSKFLEKPIPEIFIAAPITGSNGFDESLLSTVRDDIQSEFGEDQVNVIFDKRGYNWLEYDDVPLPMQYLKSFKTKRFFILFLDDFEKFSFSFLQMGYALGFCKYIVLVHKKGVISDTVRNIEDLKLFTRFSYDDLKDEWGNSVSKDLFRYIKGRLPRKNIDNK